MKLEITYRYKFEAHAASYPEPVGYKVVLRQRNGKVMMQSRAWSPRKIDAVRIALVMSKELGLPIHGWVYEEYLKRKTAQNKPKIDRRF